MNRRRFPLKFYGAAFVTVMAAAMYFAHPTDAVGIAAIGAITTAWGYCLGHTHGSKQQ